MNTNINKINKDRYNALYSALHNFLRDKTVSVEEISKDIFDDHYITWGVNWGCKGATTVEEAYEMENNLELAADIATVLNDMKLFLVWENDKIMDSLVETDGAASAYYARLRKSIQNRIEEKDWDWLLEILTDGNE